ncbi:MAG: hypothetical protein HYW05_01805 [Candidatus Diapherotrites archaeon]|nr:hypothetical protein [Candidatus Diapherotrites archaeon]
MGWAIESAIEVFKKSLDYKKLWFSYFLLLIISLIIGGIILIAVVGVPAAMLFSKYLVLYSQYASATGSSELAAMGIIFALLQALPQILTALVIVAVAYFVINALWDAFLSGLQLNIALDYLKKAKFSIGSASAKTKPRFLTLFALSIIFGILIFLLALVLFLPLLFSALGIMNQISTGAASGALASPGADLWVNILLQTVFAIFAFVVVMLLAAPFLAMIAPVALFEKRGIGASIGRMIALGKKDYLSTLGYLILVGLLMAVVSWVIGFLQAALALIPFAGIVFYIVISAVLGTWSMAFISLALAKLYQVKAPMK